MLNIENLCQDIEYICKHRSRKIPIPDLLLFCPTDSRLYFKPTDRWDGIFDEPMDTYCAIDTILTAVPTSTRIDFSYPILK